MTWSYMLKIPDYDIRLPIDEQLGKSRFCSICFSEHLDYLEDGLCICNFNTLSEWAYNVPLPLQLLFEQTFMNRSSLRRADQNPKKLQYHVNRFLWNADQGNC